MSSKLVVHLVSGHDMAIMDSGGTSDPYVNIQINDSKKTKQKSKIIKKNLNPVWNQSFTFEKVGIDDTVKFFVKDKDFGSADPLGDCQISLKKVAEHGEGEMDIYLENVPVPKSGSKPKSFIRVRFAHHSEEAKLHRQLSLDEAAQQKRKEEEEAKHKKDEEALMKWVQEQNNPDSTAAPAVDTALLSTQDHWKLQTDDSDTDEEVEVQVEVHVADDADSDSEGYDEVHAEPVEPGFDGSDVAANAEATTPPITESTAVQEDKETEQAQPAQPAATPTSADSTTPSTTTTTTTKTAATARKKTKSALLKGLRNGDLKKAVQKMEDDEAAVPDVTDKKAVVAVEQPQAKGEQQEEGQERLQEEEEEQEQTVTLAQDIDTDSVELADDDEGTCDVTCVVS